MPSALISEGDSVIITPNGPREAGKLEHQHMSPDRHKSAVTAGAPNASRSAILDQSNTSDLNLAGAMDPQDTKVRGSVEMASQMEYDNTFSSAQSVGLKNELSKKAGQQRTNPTKRTSKK